MKINKEKLRFRLIMLGLMLLFGWISVAYSADLKEDDNKTQDELTKYNEKYLKGKLHSESQKDIANMVKLSDLAKQKQDINVTMQKIDTNQSKEIYSIKESKEAQSITTLVNDREFLNKVKDNKKFILENYKIGGEKMEVSENLNKTLGQEVNTKGQGKEKIFIVISSSMPSEQIREYFRAVDGKENISFVLRGLVGGVSKFEPTRQYLENLIKKNPSDKESQEVYNVAVDINPKITKKYKIDKVPAIVYVRNYDNQVEKPEALKDASGEEFWVSYGLASLEYIIEQINKEAKSKWLEDLLKKDTFFNQRENKK